MFRDRLLYRLFVMLLIISAFSMLSLYAITHNEINRIKMGDDISLMEKRVLNDLISVSFYIFFLSFLLSLFLSKKILYPLRELQRGAMSIKEGNLISIPELKTYDELMEIIHVFNDMSVALKEKREELERTNLEIKSARDFLETIMDSIEDEIIIIDRDMNIVRANRAALKKYSINLEDINKTCYGVFHKREERCDLNNCPARIVFEYGRPYKTVHSHKNGDGEDSYHEIMASPVFDSNGKVLYMIEVSRDITERMRFDAELNRKNKELSALNRIAELLPMSLTNRHAIQEAIFRLVDMLDMDDGGIFIMDEGTDEIVCYFTDRRLPCGNNILSNVIKTGIIHVSSDISDNKEIPPFLRDLGVKSCCCLPLKGRDKILGALYLYSTRSHHFSDEEKAILNSVADMIGIAIEGIKTYDELRNMRIAEKGLAEMVFNSINEGLYTVDNNYVITSANKAMEEILGLSSHDIIGKRCMDVIGHREAGTDDRLCDKDCPVSSSLSGKAITRNIEYVRPDGKRLSLRSSCSPLKDSTGKVIGAVEVFVDITREREIDRMKTEFIGTVSHEFRTPLSAIIGMTEMLLDEEVKGERAKEYLHTILQEGRRLAALVSDLLDLSRIKSGEWVIHKEEIDFNLLMEEVKKTLSSLLERKKIKLETSIGNALKFFEGDKDKLKQVLINLVTNSINYSDEGCMINVDISKREEKLLITVSDTGWGIPEEDIPHLTKRFYRGKHGLNTKGTGLGLALCKEIARLHGGDISIVSKLGQGTKVTVEIPFKEDRNE